MKDTEIIKSLGGVLAVARRLGYSYQRVHNWVQRDRIPPEEKLKHSWLRCEDLRPDVDWAFLRSGGSK